MQAKHLLLSVTISVLVTLGAVAGLETANKKLNPPVVPTNNYYVVAPNATVATSAAGFNKAKASLAATPTASPTPTFVPLKHLLPTHNYRP